MLTFKQLDELGAQLCAGRVVYNQEFVEGTIHKDRFEPEPGSALDFPEAVKKAVAPHKAKVVVEVPVVAPVVVATEADAL